MWPSPLRGLMAIFLLCLASELAALQYHEKHMIRGGITSGLTSFVASPTTKFLPATCKTIRNREGQKRPEQKLMVHFDACYFPVHLGVTKKQYWDWLSVRFAY